MTSSDPNENASRLESKDQKLTEVTKKPIAEFFGYQIRAPVGMKAPLIRVLVLIILNIVILILLRKALN